MKKLVIIGLVGLSLSGCSDDKVTKEYLVGDWRCNWESFERMDSGRKESYGIAIDKDEYIRTFKIISGKLYNVYGKDEKDFYDVDYINNNPTYEILNNDSVFTGTRKLEKINEDQYQFIIESEFKKKSNMSNIIDIRSKEITNCTRIK
jgi:hypothetical protein